ncbi:hypothetical protein [Dyella choica]|uniref:hypothetical protein n=1 Tax=Dyella choica TaxID=1927959 RepID=UPI000F86B7AF|nr:hypothetical protein [Dyella choica]
MHRSTHRYGTPFGPFVPYGPMTLPLGWWANAVFHICGVWSETVVRAMIFPCELPPAPGRGPGSSPSNAVEKKPGYECFRHHDDPPE